MRFEDESLDDSWYQFALTVNAALPFGDLVVSASYFDRDFRYEADATDYEFNSTRTRSYYDADRVYDFGGDPRGFATNDEQTEITTFEARLQSQRRFDEPLGLAGRRVLQQGDRSHRVRQLHARLRGHAVFRVLQLLRGPIYTGDPLAPTERWFLGRYDTELEQKAVFGELSFDVTENFTITAGGRWFDYDRQFAQHQAAARGFSGVLAAGDDTDDRKTARSSS